MPSPPPPIFLKALPVGALDAVIEFHYWALKAGDSVVLVCFGTFAVKDRAARHTVVTHMTGNSDRKSVLPDPWLQSR